MCESYKENIEKNFFPLDILKQNNSNHEILSNLKSTSWMIFAAKQFEIGIPIYRLESISQDYIDQIYETRLLC